jgi:hypothetical protein
MNRQIFSSIVGFLLVVSTGNASSAEMNQWTTLRPDPNWKPIEQRNYQLGVLASGLMLCQNFTLYSQVNALSNDILFFEKGKASVVRDYRILSKDQCKQILLDATQILTQ